TVAADLFGARFAQSLLAVGSDLDELIDKARKSGEFMSKDAVEGAAKFADAIDHLSLRIKALGGEAIAPQLHWASDLSDLLRNGELTKAFAMYLIGTSSIGLGGSSHPTLQPIRPMASHGAEAPMSSHGMVSAETTAQAAAMRNQLEGLKKALSELT